MEENASDEDEGTEDDVGVSGTNEENIQGVDSLQLLDQEEPTLDCAKVDKLEGGQQQCESGPSSVPGTENTSDEEDLSADENDQRLVKSLNKQRKHAVSAAHRRRTTASRNSYKDKGGRSSNSKIQKQLASW
ncbi:hypothetical protein TIFTF001_017108 [Ficus carica]|uniref:Uncharacterized protein n=1 Tax=Ficus carica TaxID=3494 RepID=A0AA88DAF3_FICCA|nr:hypothetical protein TIFTF001_017108 [Ficus carica]